MRRSMTYWNATSSPPNDKMNERNNLINLNRRVWYNSTCLTVQEREYYRFDEGAWLFKTNYF